MAKAPQVALSLETLGATRLRSAQQRAIAQKSQIDQWLKGTSNFLLFVTSPDTVAAALQSLRVYNSRGVLLHPPPVGTDAGDAIDEQDAFRSRLLAALGDVARDGSVLYGVATTTEGALVGFRWAAVQVKRVALVKADEPAFSSVGFAGGNKVLGHAATSTLEAFASEVIAARYPRPVTTVTTTTTSAVASATAVATATTAAASTTATTATKSRPQRKVVALVRTSTGSIDGAVLKRDLDELMRSSAAGSVSVLWTGEHCSIKPRRCTTAEELVAAVRDIAAAGAVVLVAQCENAPRVGTRETVARRRRLTLLCGEAVPRIRWFELEAQTRAALGTSDIRAERCDAATWTALFAVPRSASTSTTTAATATTHPPSGVIGAVVLHVACDLLLAGDVIQIRELPLGDTASPLLKSAARVVLIYCSIADCIARLDRLLPPPQPTGDSDNGPSAKVRKMGAQCEQCWNHWNRTQKQGPAMATASWTCCAKR